MTVGQATTPPTSDAFTVKSGCLARDRQDFRRLKFYRQAGGYFTAFTRCTCPRDGQSRRWRTRTILMTILMAVALAIALLGVALTSAAYRFAPVSKHIAGGDIVLVCGISTAALGSLGALLQIFTV